MAACLTYHFGGVSRGGVVLKGRQTALLGLRLVHVLKPPTVHRREQPFNFQLVRFAQRYPMAEVRDAGLNGHVQSLFRREAPPITP